MRDTYRRLAVLFLTLAMLLSVCPLGAFAAEGEDSVTEPAVSSAPELPAEPTSGPTSEPTAEPTTGPTEEPTAEPTAEPAASSTPEPSAEPAEEPSDEPSDEPTDETAAPPADGPAAPAEPVETQYYDPDTGAMADVSAVPLTGAEETLEAGRYVVQDPVVLESALQVTGAAELILRGSLTVPGIHIAEGASLSIWNYSPLQQDVLQTGPVTGGGSFILRGGAVTVSGDVSCALPIVTGGSLRVDGTLVSQPTDGQGAPVYLLQVDNPDGAADVTIGGRPWPTACHGSEGVLYAWIGTDPDDPEGAVTVSVGGTETRYALADGVFQPLYDAALTAVSEPLPLEEDVYRWDAPYYDPLGNRVRTVNAVVVSGQYPRTQLTAPPDGEEWYALASATVDFLYIEGDVNLIVGNGTDFVVNQNIYMSSGSHLTIWGTYPDYERCGSLTVSKSGLGNNVTINGGRITAIGSNGVAGINGTVTINGGLVDATGGYDAAGIGGGTSTGGTVTITGGTVIARGGERAAGIGGGNEPVWNADTTVNITGGTVTATGGIGGAGIGSGSASARNTTVTISGGAVTAAGGSGGAGIGSGRAPGPSGSTSVTIEGGAVTATAGGDGAAIGTGGGGSCPANVTISGGTVTANGGAGIGNGGGVTGGSLTITKGSVKGTCSIQPKDEEGRDLYLLKVDNVSGVSVNINGKEWSPLNHSALDSGDGTLYAWVPGETAHVSLNGGEAADYLFINSTFVSSFGYDWTKARWEWAEDYSTATLVVPNRLFALFNSLRWTVPASLTKSTEPDCETAGVREYTVSVTVNGVDYTDTRTVTLDPLGHDWDYEHGKLRPLMMGKIMVYCKNDHSHHQLFSVSGTRYGEVDPKPDCGTGKAGRQPVYRQFTVDGKTYEVRDTDRLVYTTHTLGEWQTDETGTYRICQVCGAKVWDHIHKWKLPDPVNEKEKIHWDSIWGREEETDPEEKYLTTDGYLTLDVTCTVSGCQYAGETMHHLTFETSRTITEPTCETTGTMQEYVELSGGSYEGAARYEKEAVTIPTLGHDWGTPVFTYTREQGSLLSQDELNHPEKYCSLALRCSRCGETIDAEPAQSVSMEVEEPAACEETGIARLVFTAVYGGKIYRNDNEAAADQTLQPQNRVIPATGHSWDRAEVSWSSDHSSAVVTFFCGNDPGHTQKVTVTPAAVVTAPTCEEPGSTIWTADASRKADELGYTGNAVFTETEVLPSLGGHRWDVEGDTYPLDAGVTEGTDRTTLTIHCLNDYAHTQTVPAVLERVDAECTDATCTAEGQAVFQMVFQFNGERHTVEPETIPIPKCPHEWTDWKLESEDLSGRTYKRTCRVCSETETSEEEYTYTLPETLGAGAWQLDQDGNALYVEVTAERSDGKTETLTYSGSQIEKNMDTAPTCTAKGQVTYTVTASVGVKGESGYAEKTYTRTVPVPALGHQWRSPTAAWLDADTKVTFTFTCDRDAGHKEEIVKPVLRNAIRPAGCTEPGEDNLYASAELDGVSGFVSKPVETLALGHDWDAEGETVPLIYGVEGDFTTVTYSCRRDSRHTQTVYAVLELVESECKEPACEEAGKDVYRMTYTVDGKEHTVGDPVEYTVPPLGHLWGTDGTCTRAGCSKRDEKYAPNVKWDLPDPKDPTDASRVRWTQPAAGGRPYLTVTAYRVDEKGELLTDGDGVPLESETITVDSSSITRSGETDADCEKAGMATYSATVKLGDQEKTYTAELPYCPPLGHLWAHPVAEWSDDYATVKFTYSCERVGEHQMTLDAQVKRESVTAATCTEPGEDHLYASVELNGVGGFSSKLVDTPALGHTYVDGVCVRCGARDPSYKAPAGSAGKGTAGSGVPDTGDGQEPLLWAALLAGCAGALAVLVTGRRRKMSKR